MKSLTILVILFIATASSPAQDDETKCCCSTYDTSVCLSKVYKKVDTDLNETYKEALKATVAKYTAKDVHNLKDAEQKWMAYRDAECKAEYGLWGGGTGGPSALTSCLIAITRKRTDELRNFNVGMR